MIFEKFADLKYRYGNRHFWFRGYYFFAESNGKLVFNSKAKTLKTFKFLVIVALVISTLIDATFVWKLADMFMGIMAIPNIIALFILSGEVRKILYDYDKIYVTKDKGIVKKVS